jgi:hypothetical protein
MTSSRLVASFKSAKSQRAIGREQLIAAFLAKFVRAKMIAWSQNRGRWHLNSFLATCSNREKGGGCACCEGLILSTRAARESPPLYRLLLGVVAPRPVRQCAPLPLLPSVMRPAQGPRSPQ